MKRDVREREEFLSFKNLLARKKTSLSKVSKEIGVSREYIYLCFWKNNTNSFRIRSLKIIHILFIFSGRR